MFVLKWKSTAQWIPILEPARISPRYGVIEDSHKLTFKYKGLMGVSLNIVVIPYKKMYT